MIEVTEMVCEHVILAIGLPGGWEWIFIGIVGLLIFGNRLPDVGRSLGRGLVEFKKGLKGVQDEIDKAGDQASKDDPPGGNEGH